MALAHYPEVSSLLGLLDPKQVAVFQAQRAAVDPVEAEAGVLVALNKFIQDDFEKEFAALTLHEQSEFKVEVGAGVSSFFSESGVEVTIGLEQRIAILNNLNHLLRSKGEHIYGSLHAAQQAAFICAYKIETGKDFNPAAMAEVNWAKLLPRLRVFNSFLSLREAISTLDFANLATVRAFLLSLNQIFKDNNEFFPGISLQADILAPLFIQAIKTFNLEPAAVQKLGFLVEALRGSGYAGRVQPLLSEILASGTSDIVQDDFLLVLGHVANGFGNVLEEPMRSVMSDDRKPEYHLEIAKVMKLLCPQMVDIIDLVSNQPLSDALKGQVVAAVLSKIRACTNDAEKEEIYQQYQRVKYNLKFLKDLMELRLDPPSIKVGFNDELHGAKYSTCYHDYCILKAFGKVSLDARELVFAFPSSTALNAFERSCRSDDPALYVQVSTLIDGRKAFLKAIEAGHYSLFIKEVLFDLNDFLATRPSQQDISAYKKSVTEKIVQYIKSFRQEAQLLSFIEEYERAKGEVPASLGALMTTYRGLGSSRYKDLAGQQITYSEYRILTTAQECLRVLSKSDERAVSNSDVARFETGVALSAYLASFPVGGVVGDANQTAQYLARKQYYRADISRLFDAKDSDYLPFGIADAFIPFPEQLAASDAEAIDQLLQYEVANANAMLKKYFNEVGHFKPEFAHVLTQHLISLGYAEEMIPEVLADIGFRKNIFAGLMLACRSYGQAYAAYHPDPRLNQFFMFSFGGLQYYFTSGRDFIQPFTVESARAYILAYYGNQEDYEAACGKIVPSVTAEFQIKDMGLVNKLRAIAQKIANAQDKKAFEQAVIYLLAKNDKTLLSGLLALVHLEGSLPEQVIQNFIFLHRAYFFVAKTFGNRHPLSEGLFEKIVTQDPAKAWKLPTTKAEETLFYKNLFKEIYRELRKVPDDKFVEKLDSIRKFSPNTLSFNEWLDLQMAVIDALPEDTNEEKRRKILAYRNVFEELTLKRQVIADDELDIILAFAKNLESKLAYPWIKSLDESDTAIKQIIAALKGMPDGLKNAAFSKVLLMQANYLLVVQALGLPHPVSQAFFAQMLSAEFEVPVTKATEQAFYQDLFGNIYNELAALNFAEVKEEVLSAKFNAVAKMSARLLSDAEMSALRAQAIASLPEITLTQKHAKLNCYVRSVFPAGFSYFNVSTFDEAKVDSFLQLARMDDQFFFMEAVNAEVILAWHKAVDVDSRDKFREKTRIENLSSAELQAEIDRAQASVSEIQAAIRPVQENLNSLEAEKAAVKAAGGDLREIDARLALAQSDLGTALSQLSSAKELLARKQDALSIATKESLLANKEFLSAVKSVDEFSLRSADRILAKARACKTLAEINSFQANFERAVVGDIALKGMLSGSLATLREHINAHKAFLEHFEAWVGTYHPSSFMQALVMRSQLALASSESFEQKHAVKMDIAAQMLARIEKCHTKEEVLALFAEYQKAKHELANSPLKQLMVELRKAHAGLGKKSRFIDHYQGGTFETSQTDSAIIKAMKERYKVLKKKPAVSAPAVIDDKVSTYSLAKGARDNDKYVFMPISTDAAGVGAGAGLEVITPVTPSRNVDGGEASPERAAEVVSSAANDLEKFRRKPVYYSTTCLVIAGTLGILAGAAMAVATAGLGLIPVAIAAAVAIKASVFAALSLGAAAATSALTVGAGTAVSSATSSLCFAKKTESDTAPAIAPHDTFVDARAVK